MQNCRRVVEKHENESPDYGIEQIIALQLGHIRTRECHVLQPGFRDANSGSGDGLLVPRRSPALRPRAIFFEVRCSGGLSFDSDDLSLWTYEPGSQDGHVAGDGAKIQNTLSWVITRFL
jgi:hypothetical protein